MSLNRASHNRHEFVLYTVVVELPMRCENGSVTNNAV
jgi:hypothetical protein